MAYLQNFVIGEALFPRGSHDGNQEQSNHAHHMYTQSPLLPFVKTKIFELGVAAFAVGLTYPSSFSHNAGEPPDYTRISKRVTWIILSDSINGTTAIALTN